MHHLLCVESGTGYLFCNFSLEQGRKFIIFTLEQVKSLGESAAHPRSKIKGVPPPPPPGGGSRPSPKGWGHLTMNVEFCEDNSGRSKKMDYFQKNKGPPGTPGCLPWIHH